MWYRMGGSEAILASRDFAVLEESDLVSRRDEEANMSVVSSGGDGKNVCKVRLRDGPKCGE